MLRVNVLHHSHLSIKSDAFSCCLCKQQTASRQHSINTSKLCKVTRRQVAKLLTSDGFLAPPSCSGSMCCNTLICPSMAMRPLAVLAKGKEVVNSVGPTPVLHTARPYGITSPVLSVASVSVSFFTIPCAKCIHQHADDKPLFLTHFQACFCGCNIHFNYPWQQ